MLETFEEQSRDLYEKWQNFPPIYEMDCFFGIYIINQMTNLATFHQSLAD